MTHGLSSVTYHSAHCDERCGGLQGAQQGATRLTLQGSNLHRRVMNELLRFTRVAILSNHGFRHLP